MRSTVKVALLAAAFAVATVALGWWTVPVLSAAWGIAARGDDRSTLTAGVSAALAWGALLALFAMGAPIADVASKVGAIMKVGGVGLVALTLVFPALLAASAAGVTSALRREPVVAYP